MNKEYQKEIVKGTHGEEHFLDYELWCFFGLRRHEVEDLRGNKREGEIRLPDGRLVEIKSDHAGNMGRYKNMLVEIEHPDHAGWYHHCKQNGVTNLIVEAFRTGETHPYFVLHVPFDQLSDLIEMEGHTFRKTVNGCLRVPVRRILQTCIGAAVLPEIFTSEEHREYLTILMRDAMQAYGFEGQIQAQDIVTRISTQVGVHDLCNSLLPEDHPVFSITLIDPVATKK